jgi:hypothetical protein
VGQLLPPRALPPQRRLYGFSDAIVDAWMCLLPAIGLVCAPPVTPRQMSIWRSIREEVEGRQQAGLVLLHDGADGLRTQQRAPEERFQAVSAPRHAVGSHTHPILWLNSRFRASGVAANNQCIISTPTLRHNTQCGDGSCCLAVKLRKEL